MGVPNTHRYNIFFWKNALRIGLLPRSGTVMGTEQWGRQAKTVTQSPCDLTSWVRKRGYIHGPVQKQLLAGIDESEITRLRISLRH